MSYVARSLSRESLTTRPRLLSQTRKETGRGWMRRRARQLEAWRVRGPPTVPGKITRELRLRWRVMRRRRGASLWSRGIKRRARRAWTGSRRRSASSRWTTPSRRRPRGTASTTPLCRAGSRSRRKRTSAQTLGISFARKVMAQQIGSELHLNISPKSATFLIWSIKLNESRFNLEKRTSTFSKTTQSQCCRGWQVYLLAAGLSGGWAPGVPGPGQDQGHRDPQQSRPGWRGEDLQMVPPLAQQVQRVILHVVISTHLSS